MTWYVKVKSADGSVTPILKDDWNDAVREVSDFRKAGREAWLEDTVGRVLDETTGRPR